LAGVPAEFPTIVASRQLFFETITSAVGAAVKFSIWKPSAEEIVKYFKGERYGTKQLCKSGPRRQSAKISIKTLKKTLGRAIDRAQGQLPPDPSDIAFVHSFMNLLRSGPPWAKQSLDKFVVFLREETLIILKDAQERLSGM
jgi:hypothetical protein